MMLDYSSTIWIALIPFFVFIFLGLFGHKFKPIVSGIVGSTGLGAAFVMSWMTAFRYFLIDGKVNDVYQKIIGFNTTWLHFTDKLHIDMGALIDPISVMMLVVVSTVSFMVHIYSIGYMKGEVGYHRFFAFLSLFTFSMLGLVIATNIFQMYIFWELVGVSSFLLIGFYYQKPSAVSASKKAFIVTRFADLGFLIGILILSYYAGTFDFKELTNTTSGIITSAPAATFMGASVMTWSLVLVFMGGAGKSAMFPLHIWLPDAMEGPTPVSALIHAATMVVAGVYLVARLFPVYALTAPAGLEIVAYVGAFSSLFAAIIACTQFDIKRVLAYSTMSQIGYMMFALGMSGYGEGHESLGYMASMFHLFTHAFFKALMFLGAGAVIHAVHANEMTQMGGLKKYMPWTYWTFLIGWLAISGVPGLSGFFSKDEILAAAFEHNKFLFFSQLFVAGLTAFYMSRLFFRVFHNKEPHYHHTPHEAPWIMRIPLIVLAVGAALAGYIPFGHYVTATGVAYDIHINWTVASMSIAVGVIGILIGFALYYKETSIPEKISVAFGGFYRAAFRKFYFDEIYMFVTKKVIFRYISVPVAWFDRQVVDGTMNAMSDVTNYTSEKIKGFQSGRMQDYGLVFLYGVVLLVIIFLFMWK
jgi:NADH-quinone oxidoreductase subunit L